MSLKKKAFGADEEAVFDDAIIYKRGDYWHFRMWLAKERKYARLSRLDMQQARQKQAQLQQAAVGTTIKPHA